VRRALAEGDLPARTFHPSHVNRRKALFEEAVALTRQGSYIDLTAFPVADDEDAWSAESALIRYLDMGGPADQITVSSDGGGCLPVFDDDGVVAKYDVASPAAVLAALRGAVDQGLPLAQALPAFTANPARLLRLHGKGQVNEGADADLLCLNADLTLHSAMYGGRWYNADGEPDDNLAKGVA
jgi:beta-aspartyl-dipeptidase (metallo-type)